ncbi:MAG: EutP/PduV family microcompartment system protein [Negativicutes bacterium]|jgi:ethanolamine utilization protein EutP|nr:EutP/PduV family microcompartment system protein [Negativicutes bacterium]
MRKVIFIGQTGSGKTSLCQYLHDIESTYLKTQQVSYYQDAIDTPGEFLENRLLYNALIGSSVDAEYVGFVQSVDSQVSSYPPSFAMTFTRPAIGVITKIDKARDEKQIEQARNYLRLAGVKQIFETSTLTGEGLEEFTQWLFEATKK